MVECPVCLYHYSSARSHCPTCGAIPNRHNGSIHAIKHVDSYRTLVVANGAERARQLPQSPIRFELVD